MSNSCLRESRKATSVLVLFFFFITVVGGVKGRQEMKEKEVKEERGKHGVFNLQSTGERAREGRRESSGEAD